MPKETIIKLGIRSIIAIVMSIFGWFIVLQININQSLAFKIENKMEIEQYRHDQSRLDERLGRIEDKIDKLLSQNKQ
jgi:hypothetical protein